MSQEMLEFCYEYRYLMLLRSKSSHKFSKCKDIHHVHMQMKYYLFNQFLMFVVLYMFLRSHKFYLEYCRELLLTELQPTSIIPGILQILIYGYNETLSCKCSSVKVP